MLKEKYQTLRFILGDQLNAGHSWYKTNDDNILYVIAELYQEQTYVKHHIQKTAAFFLAMQNFAAALKKAGHHVLYLTLDETLKNQHQSLQDCLIDLCQRYQVASMEYQRPDEARLLEQFDLINKQLSVLNIACQQYDSEHYLLPFDEIEKYINPGKHNRMESFYRKMRKRYNLLMDGDKPIGGKWNYDAENRKSFKAADLPAIPTALSFNNNVEAIVGRIKKYNLATIGDIEATIVWPLNQQQSLELLDHFCQHCLRHFGEFQDAMTCESKNTWSLYHSRLSFSLNTKMLHPRQVIDAAIKAYKHGKGSISLAQVEGFVRQILGWREYIRAVYWANQPDYGCSNQLKAKNKLPEWFWTAETNMRCMHYAIKQSLEFAYAHHIQRLMITGNFSLLAGIDPDQVEAWYLGIYIDAIEWVEQPNTRGMVLFSDGGWVATKPYAASGNYINKMSDYCKDCAYSVKKKTGSDACPFNSLYWYFLNKNHSMLSSNPRLAFPYKTWSKMENNQQQALIARAKYLIQHIDEL